MAPLERPIAVIGTGVMGLGIAEVLAVGGLTVLLFDSAPGKAEAGAIAIAASLERRVDKGRLGRDLAEQAVKRLSPVAALRDVAPAGIVIEAIAENLSAKHALIGELAAVLAPDCIVATNTSSLSVTAIAAAYPRPRRVAGMHFFNPVPAMKIVEVIAGAHSDEDALVTLAELAVRVGHHPVRASDSPGFIVNHAGRGYGTEALAILREGVAPVATIDAILREGAGFPMGPFELLDLTGLDVSHPVMESLYEQFYHEPRFRPSPIARQRLAAGMLGRKSGQGFYRYGEDRPDEAVPVAARTLPFAVRILPGPGADVIAALALEAGVELGDDGPIVVPLVGDDATAAALRLGTDPTRTLGFDPFFGLSTHRTLIATPATDPRARAQALALFTSDGKKASLVEDTAGAVCQRVVATIVNIACDMVQNGIADGADIDIAVRLGLRYPHGPLAWGDLLGARNVMAMLAAMHTLSGDPRYRPSPRLRRHAALGLPLL